MSPTVVLCLLFLVSCVSSKEIVPNYNDFAKKIINYDKVIAPIVNSPEGINVALKMLDASTKIPNGLLDLNFFDLGDFDECYNIEYDGKYGKYCLGTIPLNQATADYFQIQLVNITEIKMPMVHPQPRLPGLGSELTGYHFAACVLSNISASDIGFLSEYHEELCYSKANEPQLSTGAKITIAFLAIIWAIICASTVYDVYLYYSKQSTRHELLIAFSLWTNAPKIFKSTTNPDQLLCLNGIKAFSMMWVIIGHEYASVMDGPVTNLNVIKDYGQDPAHMFLFGSTVSVDTFFVIGGLVTVYTFMRAVRKGEKFNIVLFYLHRYLRLTPALGITMLVQLYLLKYMGSGPLWNSVELLVVPQCEKTWWGQLLYITNFLKKGTCGIQMWYLSVDMQLFVLSPIVLLLLPKWPKFGLALLGFLCVLGVLVPFSLHFFNNVDDNSTPYYFDTYARFGPYVIGMLAGYFIYKMKFDGFSVRLKPNHVMGLWLVFLTGMVACVYGGYPLTVQTKPDLWGNSLFAAFNRPAWGVVISGIIFLCVSGYGGPIDAILSLPVFQFLTKLSYSMYLLHIAVLTVRNGRYKNPVTFSNYDVMHYFWGDFMWTLVFAFLMCVSFESPMIVLEKHLFGLFRKKPAKVTPRNKEEV